MVAPASKASWVDSTCSDTVIGTEGLLAFVGKLPVMATQIMQGLVMISSVWTGRQFTGVHQLRFDQECAEARFGV
jgi:hypothetical protein